MARLEGGLTKFKITDGEGTGGQEVTNFKLAILKLKTHAQTTATRRASTRSILDLKMIALDFGPNKLLSQAIISYGLWTSHVWQKILHHPCKPKYS